MVTLNRHRKIIIYACLFSVAILLSYQIYIPISESYSAKETMKKLEGSNENISITNSSTYKTKSWPRHITHTHYPLTISSPYVINSPNVCKNVKNLAFITIVHTATDHFQRRRIIRETWANKNLFKSISTRIVFVFGLTKDTNVQALLENEQVIHGDIIQGDFLDHYHNLTHKGVLAFRWVSEYCSHAKVIVKVDDDIFMNPFLLIQNILPRYKNVTRFIMGHLRRQGTSWIMRGETDKWNVHKGQFQGYIYYPVPYPNGYFVLISPEIISALYHASALTPFFWVDDVYLYGLLPFMIGHVVHTDIREYLSLSSREGKLCYKNPKSCNLLAVNAGKPESVEEMWMQILKNLSEQQKALINSDFIITRK
ncbi:beta-1,3-galactosyltransferase 1-like [Patella vulgata]|uniref:beta-1,3-galactosyltransferase 1-like n=1 Tax=Patella vulgata TaxID=6465 RepID=UPI0021800407|nr:beta-1,3-galactosyltransferase 1-like [Patella vulgata]